ncbi:MAG: SPFH domain-containing protein, partial [Candidatus Kariarchaeaceae archaeon]
TIGQLYDKFGDKYEDIIVKQARDVIRDVSSGFNAITFFNNRTSIGFNMEIDLRTIISEQVFADIPSFQLRAVDLPDAFENALERAEVARQEIEIAQFEQESALIRAETAIFESEAQANITLIEAQAEADGFLILINAQAEAVNITLAAQSEAYYALSQSLNLTSSELLAFLWIQALTEIGEYGNLIIIGENTPEIIIDPNANATMY